MMFNDGGFISGMGSISFSGSQFNSGMSISDELFIHSNQVFEFSSGWVKSVLEMSSGYTKSNFSVSESEVDFFVKFIMFGFHPSVFFMSTSHFEVQIFD